MTDFDIAIVGGGLSGQVLALALAGRDFKVALIESRSLFANTGPSQILDARALAMGVQTRLLLQRLQLWPESLAQAATVIKQVHISERGGFANIRIRASDLNIEALGYMIAQQNLLTTYSSYLKAAGVKVWSPAALVDCQQDQTKVQLTIDSANEKMQTISAALCVAADGPRSILRQKFQVKASEVDYNQTALVGNVALKREHGHTAFERFTKTGPLALLPMLGRHGAFVWCMPAKQASYLRSQESNELLGQLQQAFGYRAGRIEKLGAVGSFPLQQVLADQSFCGRVMFLGNACHNVHPVAGQGFNLTGRDIAHALDVLTEADNLSPECWQQLEQRQQTDQYRISWLTDRLATSFTDSSLFGHLSRQLAFLHTERNPVIKQILQKFLMGKRQFRARLQCERYV